MLCMPRYLTIPNHQKHNLEKYNSNSLCSQSSQNAPFPFLIKTSGPPAVTAAAGTAVAGEFPPWASDATAAPAPRAVAPAGGSRVTEMSIVRVLASLCLAVYLLPSSSFFSGKVRTFKFPAASAIGLMMLKKFATTIGVPVWLTTSTALKFPLLPPAFAKADRAVLFPVVFSNNRVYLRVTGVLLGGLG